MALELKRDNIRVNTISPGMVDTVSFPKTEGKPGVRGADDAVFAVDQLIFEDVTGSYIHVDELDLALERGHPPKKALKPISEPIFDPPCV